MVPPARSTLVGADDSIIIFDCQLPIADWRVSDYKVRLKKFNTTNAIPNVQTVKFNADLQGTNFKSLIANFNSAIGNWQSANAISRHQYHAVLKRSIFCGRSALGP